MSSTSCAATGLRCSLLLIASALISACDSAGQGAQNNAAPLAVAAMRVAAKPLPLVIETVGRAEGSKAVEVRARVSGILEKQLYSEGAKVRAGDLLFRIEASPFEIALAHARAALAEEQARNLQARRNADRLTGLAKERAVSQRSADDAVSALEGSDAALLALQANIREAELNLSYTKVTAPINGITGRALRSEGSLLTAGAESSLLTTLTQADPMWVRFALSESEYTALREAADTKRADSMSVSVLGKDGNPRGSAGRLNFASSTIDESLGTVQLRAEFSNRDLAVLPGEYLRVRLSGGHRDSITVPQKAVLQSAQGAYVWIVNATGHAEQRVVKTGTWVGADWQIQSGLQAGDTVIVDNLLKLKSGQPVSAREIDVASAPDRANAGAQTSADASVEPAG